MAQDKAQDEDFVSTLPSDLFDEDDLDIVLSAEASPPRGTGAARLDAVVAWSHGQWPGRRTDTPSFARAAPGSGPAPMSPAASTPAPTPAFASVSVTPRPAADPTAWTEGSAPRLCFTGTGSEYFRIWIVHLMLSVATFGLYAAWAQRRRLQWWARHTLLDGDPFDFHGAPRRMLAHRLMALVLVVGVWLSMLQPFWTGAAMLGVMMLGAAALSLRIRRFRLHHLSWRGLRLGQRLSAAPRAVTVLPPALTGRPLLRLRLTAPSQRPGPSPAARLLVSRGWLLPLTLGLYWPFLAVRMARLRMDTMNARAEDLRAAIDAPALSRAGAPGTSGRALGLDMGWSP
jgi:hypothetical protein